MILAFNTFLKNDEFSDYSIHSICRYTQMGFKPKINICQHYSLAGLKKNQICFHNTLQVLKKYKGQDLLISEDDTYINKTYNELVDILEPYKDGVVRVVWQKKHKNKLGSNGYYYIGCQLIYIPKEYQDHFIEEMESTKPQHLDCWFSKCKNIKHIVIESCGGELEHYSEILGKVRRGYLP
tara:strand:+ start:507 stop:1049 length:543 start_codon:yes stop_codon:yes gene_type:complete